MTRKYIITASPDGKVKTETKGFYGPACKQASKFLEAALGDVVEDKDTPEMRQASPSESDQQHLRG